ncbi:hypothetical protein Bpfe_017844 [Biomphalaria pfeifferi]|uniref:Uncharacterized protein n=1 Tax=Biomphalaria pfeifferi TaxID=112525 RepID=A0AAD8F6S4_BIOPF|nr:hypothetical protein Bpfe_017844 [Biomphalaria pfeifferi]
MEVLTHVELSLGLRQQKRNVTEFSQNPVKGHHSVETTDPHMLTEKILLLDITRNSDGHSGCCYVVVDLEQMVEAQ